MPAFPPLDEETLTAEGHSSGLGSLITAMTRLAMAEEHLVARIIRERKDRGWSQEDLVKRLADEGCPMPQSAISKIENPRLGATRRAITVDEAIAFAKVLETSLEDLLTPVGAFGIRPVLDLVQGPKQANSLAGPKRQYDERVRRVARESVEGDETFKSILAAEIRSLFPALSVDDLAGFEEQLERLEELDLDEPVLGKAMFLRDVGKERTAMKPRKPRQRGQRK